MISLSPPVPESDCAMIVISDPERLRSVAGTGLVDAAPPESLDWLTRLASRFLNAPVSLISLITADRQFLANCAGLPESADRNAPLSHSFCKHTVIRSEPIVIEDARMHPWVKDYPATLSGAVAAYLGFPLILSDDRAIGSLCVIDVKPRSWQTDEIEVLRDLAASVVTEIEQRALAEQAHAAR